jgi:hypothetical protein
MDVPHARSGRGGRGISAFANDGVGPARRTVSRNKQWVADARSNTATPTNGGGGDSERWVRGGGGGGSRTWRGRPGNRGIHRLPRAPSPRTVFKDDAVENVPDEQEEVDGTDVDEPDDEPEHETPEERDKFYQEVRVLFDVVEGGSLRPGCFLLSW